MRLIDADALIRDIDCSADLGGELGKVVNAVKLYAKAMVQTAPTIEERKKGKWIKQYDEEDYPLGCKCSECRKAYVMPDGWANYCPSCGADMRGDTNE